MEIQKEFCNKQTKKKSIKENGQVKRIRIKQ